MKRFVSSKIFCSGLSGSLGYDSTAPMFTPNICCFLPQDTKKDPYAFDDEELELSGQDASAGNTSKTHTATTTSPSQSNTSTSQPPRHASNTGTTATAQSPSTESLLHEVQPSSTTEGIAVSPSSGSGSGAPPLKLRFAMESGHYTVMENQEQAQAGVVNSPTTETDVLQLETFTTQETEKATDKIEQEDADALSISEANLMPEDGAVCVMIFILYFLYNVLRVMASATTLNHCNSVNRRLTHPIAVKIWILPSYYALLFP